MCCNAGSLTPCSTGLRPAQLVRALILFSNMARALHFFFSFPLQSSRGSATRSRPFKQQGYHMNSCPAFPRPLQRPWLQVGGGRSWLGGPTHIPVYLATWHACFSRWHTLGIEPIDIPLKWKARIVSRACMTSMTCPTGFPLTDVQLSSSFTVVSGHDPDALDWSTFKGLPTLVLLMSGSTIPVIAER